MTGNGRRNYQAIADKKAAEDAANDARAAALAKSGPAGRYDDATQARYAELLRRNDTAGAHQTVTDAMGSEFMDERDDPAYQPERIQASTVSAPHLMDATDAGMAREYQAALADDPRDVNVGPLRDVERVDAQSAAGAGSVTHAGYDAVQGANLDTAHADKVQGQQDKYLEALEARARGEGPSVAEASYMSKQADVAKNALGIAGQARGSDKAYARLKAMDTIADNTRRAGFEAAQLRAGEMDAATGQLGAGLSNVRGQDVDVAKTAAQLRQEAALSNQRVGSQTQQFNANTSNTRDEFNVGVGERNADRAQAASAANAAAGNARTMGEAQMRADVEAGNVTREQGNAQFNAAAQTGAAATNAAAANTRQDTRAAARDAAAARNQAAINRTPEFNATQIQDAAGKNQAAGLQGNSQEIQRRDGLAGSAIQSMGQGTNIQQSRIGKPDDPSTGDRVLGAVTTLGAAGVSKYSDERVKKNIRDVPEDAASRLARALDVKEFEYKGRHDDGRTHVGVMAQDLERDPLGAKLVGQDDDGTKTVDYQGLTQLLLQAALRGKKEARR